MGYKVLVVDDEKDLRELFVLLLKKAGYETDVASSGNEAFHRIQESRPNLVISDIRMPEGNGLDLMKKVAQMSPPLLPILFISGYADKSETELRQFPNFAGLLTKPVAWQSLIQAVKSLQETQH